jgi:hypothetical protein
MRQSEMGPSEPEPSPSEAERSSHGELLRYTGTVLCIPLSVSSVTLSLPLTGQRLILGVVARPVHLDSSLCRSSFIARSSRSRTISLERPSLRSPSAPTPLGRERTSSTMRGSGTRTRLWTSRWVLASKGEWLLLALPASIAKCESQVRRSGLTGDSAWADLRSGSFCSSTSGAGRRVEASVILTWRESSLGYQAVSHSGTDVRSDRLSTTHQVERCQPDPGSFHLHGVDIRSGWASQVSPCFTSLRAMS